MVHVKSWKWRSHQNTHLNAEISTESLQCCISRSCSADSILILVTVSTNVTSPSTQSWILCGKLPVTIIFTFASLSERLVPKCKVWLFGQINITDGLSPVCALHVGWNQYVLCVWWNQLVHCMMGEIMANDTTKPLSRTLKNIRFGVGLLQNWSRSD